MKITVLSHNLSSNAVMRAHRLTLAAGAFAAVKLIGPIEEQRGLWPALPAEPWIQGVPERRLPKFARSFLELVGMADGDVLIAAKPHLASFGVALVASEQKNVPLILDHDDYDLGFVERSRWAEDPHLADPRRPSAATYLSLLTKASSAATAITVASSALQRRFGGTLLSHSVNTEVFDPDKVDRQLCRQQFGFNTPTILFAGTPRKHKGIEPLLQAVQRVPGARVAVTCREQDLAEPEWSGYQFMRIPFVSYDHLPKLLAAADIVVVSQLDTEVGRYQMPMKVYEAMAMAKPIVASTVSDLPTLLEGCARLVAPGDVDQLCAAIAELLQDPQKALLLGQQCRQRILERFTLGHMAEQLHSVARQACDSFARQIPRANLI